MTLLKKKIKMIIAAAVIALAAAVLFIPSQNRLCVMRGGQLLFAETIEEGGYFSIRYNHSVNRSPVVDTIEYTPDGELPLTVRTSLYQTFGAGIPIAEDGGTLKATEDGLLLSGIDRTYKQIDLMTGTYADHYLITESGEHQLKAIAGEQKHITISVGKLSLFSLIMFNLSI